MALNLIQIQMRLRGHRAVQAGARAVSTSMQQLGAAATGAARGATSSLARIGTAMAGLRSRGMALKNAGSSMTSGLTVPLALVGYAAGKMSIDFDKSMRNVNSIAQLPEQQFQSLRDSVLDMSDRVNQSAGTMAEGLYDLVSSGFDAKESLVVLEASAKAATAGLTSTEVSAKVVAGVLNAYRLPAEKAGEVSDILFRTVDRGVIKFEELATTLGDVLPFASSLNVGLEEVGASVSTMTKAGIPAPETMTRIKNTMVALIKPSEALKGNIKELGYESGEALIAEKGFQGALDAIIGSTDGSKKAVAKLFPNIRALGGVLALTGKNSKAAAEDIKGFGEAAGSTDRALNEQRKSVDFQLRELRNKLEKAAIKIGDVMLPVVLPIFKSIANAVVDVAEAFGKLPKPVQTTAIAMLLILAAAGPMLMFIGSLIIAIAALGAGLTFIAAHPVVFGLIALTAAIILAYKHSETFRDILSAIAGVIKSVVVGAFTILGNVAESVWNWIKSHWRMLALILGGPIGIAVIAIVNNFDKIKAVASAVFGWLRGAATDVAGWVSGAFTDMKGAIVDVWKGVEGIVVGVLNAMIDALNFFIRRFNDAFDRSISLPLVGEVFEGVHIDEIGKIGAGGGGSGGGKGGGKGGFSWTDLATGIRPRPRGAEASAADRRRGSALDRPRVIHSHLHLNGREVATVVQDERDRERARR